MENPFQFLNEEAGLTPEQVERCLPGCLCRRCRRVAALLPGLPYYPF